jgi:EF hand
MRARILLGLFAAGTMALVIGSASHGQIPGGGGFPGGGRGGQKRQRDPNFLFNRFANGNPYIVVADISETFPIRGYLLQYAQQTGITDGKITQTQFADFNTSELGMAFSQATRGKKGGVRIGMGAPPGAPGAPGAPQGNSPELLQQMADADFKKYDANGDGMLNADEMPGALKQSLKFWDKNGDGLIDGTEYRAFFITRLQTANGGKLGPAQLAPAAPAEDDLDTRPVVYRAGKLPEKGLPPWFKKLDTDGDAQVALYEWRAAGKDMAEFKKWDRDDDGFITPEEALYVQAALTKASPQATTGAFGRPGGAPAFTPGGGGKKRGGGG